VPAGVTPLITGTGFTVITTLLVCVVPGTVAVRVTVIVTEVSGAVYVGVVPVVVERVPQVLPVHVGPFIVQVRERPGDTTAVTGID
jgi:hypothetical protein